MKIRIVRTIWGYGHAEWQYLKLYCGSPANDNIISSIAKWFINLFVYVVNVCLFTVSLRTLYPLHRLITKHLKWRFVIQQSHFRSFCLQNPKKHAKDRQCWADNFHLCTQERREAEMTCNSLVTRFVTDRIVSTGYTGSLLVVWIWKSPSLPNRATLGYCNFSARVEWVELSKKSPALYRVQQTTSPTSFQTHHNLVPYLSDVATCFLVLHSRKVKRRLGLFWSPWS